VPETLVRAFDDLLHPRPVQANLTRNLAIAYAISAHGEDVGTELIFIRITQITFG
jgi:hypothetical protein